MSELPAVPWSVDGQATAAARPAAEVARSFARVFMRFERTSSSLSARRSVEVERKARGRTIGGNEQIDRRDIGVRSASGHFGVAHQVPAAEMLVPRLEQAGLAKLRLYQVIDE